MPLQPRHHRVGRRQLTELRREFAVLIRRQVLLGEEDNFVAQPQRANRGERLDVLTLGPLTNLALALKRTPAAAQSRSQSRGCTPSSLPR